ncbi:hypothetical protein TNCV_1436221 [Trichonephila clavipes]|nr:hypothetical protein TNCV_1436221 [Trichonephila clavipes]
MLLRARTIIGISEKSRTPPRVKTRIGINKKGSRRTPLREKQELELARTEARQKIENKTRIREARHKEDMEARLEAEEERQKMEKE